MNYFKLLLLSTIALCVVSCSKDDGSDDVTPAPKYEDFVNATMENVLTKQLGITLYKGTTPPIVEGTYIPEPFYCKQSNFGDLYQGLVFGSMELKMFNQNNNRNSIDFESLLRYASSFPNGETKENWDGSGCFISGEGNTFSIFFYSSGDLVKYGVSSKYKNLIVVSGELDKNEANTIKGIKNFQMASIMADDFGDTNNALIEIGEGRLFIDSDYYANVKL